MSWRSWTTRRWILYARLAPRAAKNCRGVVLESRVRWVANLSLWENPRCRYTRREGRTAGKPCPETQSSKPRRVGGEPRRLWTVSCARVVRNYCLPALLADQNASYHPGHTRRKTGHQTSEERQ